MKAKKIQITAQPRPIWDDVATREPTEEGLSIEPEDMGQSFLRYATEQGNFESARGESVEELFPGGAPASDEAYAGVSFSAEASVWKNTVDQLVAAGGTDAMARENMPLVPEDDDPLSLEDDEAHPPERGVMEIDLTENVIDEASLLDEESDVLGEVIVKHPRTDDGPDGKSGR